MINDFDFLKNYEYYYPRSNNDIVIQKFNNN